MQGGGLSLLSQLKTSSEDPTCPLGARGIPRTLTTNFPSHLSFKVRVREPGPWCCARPPAEGGVHTHQGFTPGSRSFGYMSGAEYPQSGLFCS